MDELEKLMLGALCEDLRLEGVYRCKCTKQLRCPNWYCDLMLQSTPHTHSCCSYGAAALANAY